MSNYFNIGKIVATFGLQGEVILLHKTGTADALTGIKVLFIEEKKNSFLPWFIESVKVKNTEDLYLKLEGVDTREAARELIGKQVYLDEKNFAEKVNPDSVLYLLGFTVEDSQAGPLGAVAEVVEMPNGLLLKIYQNDHELLIPLNESTLQRMDRKSRTIYVRLPDGLLDIYRS
ncbi:MAG TPA: ribosome maturation factor RimM [Chitinophagaceae bacterium]|jgi:16S rRNA processing protein RimM|nr:ribosome maturation factor RimM [Chitinophagaceae bacterium]